MRKLDYVLIIGVLAVAAAFWLFGRKAPGNAAVIYADGAEVMTVNLAENRVFSLPDYPEVVFEVKGGAIAFIQSDCPDQVCVRTGFVGAQGQSAVCLPKRLVVSVPCDGGMDAVSR